MTGINDIKAMALAYGACEKVYDIASIREAMELLMTPQGREFAIKSGFPTIDICRECKTEMNAIPCVYVDTINVFASGHDIIAIGNSEVNVKFSEPDKLYHVIAMHGAKVTIQASNYSVVTVSSYDAEVIIEDDGTAIVYVEEFKREGGNK